MKKLILVAMALVSVSAFAEENFDKRKAEMLSHIDERMQKMQEHKSCVSAATDAAGLKACHEKMRDFHHDQKKERMTKRRDRMNEKIQKLDEKNANH